LVSMSVPSMSRNTAFTKVILLVCLGSLHQSSEVFSKTSTFPGMSSISVFQRTPAFLYRSVALGHGGPAGHAQGLAVDVARLLGGEEDIRESAPPVSPFFPWSSPGLVRPRSSSPSWPFLVAAAAAPKARARTKLATTPKTTRMIRDTTAKPNVLPPLACEDRQLVERGSR
jgi:hypothetical protein